MAGNPLHGVAIVAAYNTRQAKVLEGETDLSIIHDAVDGALKMAGIAREEVDGVNISTLRGGVSSRNGVHMMGGRPSWCGNSEMGIASVLEAASAIATGQCETAILASGQAGMYKDRSATSPWTRPSNEFVECWGLYTAAEFALIAKRHMALYGTRPESLAEVASAIRMNGARFPEAVFYGREVTPQDVLDSRMVADPYHLLDCAMNSEGGGAVILTSAEKAKDLDVDPIYLLGGALDRQGMSYVTAPVWDKYGHVGQRAAKITFEQAGLTPEDVDVCEFYDPFSFELIRQFEAFGFCEEGEGGDFVMGGTVRSDGKFPLCTNGGLMSFSHCGVIQMLQKVISGAQQLWGMYPDELTVPDAKVAMVTNGGAGALFTDTMLIGKEMP
ncbi:thiolase family protein [Myxococcota bacterium]|nr:thiolase family protein [Myxococcota bacterium]